MVNTMQQLNDITRVKKLEYNAHRVSQSEKSRSKGPLVLQCYDNYYHHQGTIVNTGATNPNDPDNVYDAVGSPLGIYMVEGVFQSSERRAEYMWFVNNTAVTGGHNMFIIVSHVDTNQFSREITVPPQTFIVLYNVYEVRVRGTANDTYTISEYEMGAL